MFCSPGHARTLRNPTMMLEAVPPRVDDPMEEISSDEEPDIFDVRREPLEAHYKVSFPQDGPPQLHNLVSNEFVNLDAETDYAVKAGNGSLIIVSSTGRSQQVSEPFKIWVGV